MEYLSKNMIKSYPKKYFRSCLAHPSEIQEYAKNHNRRGGSDLAK